MLIKDQMGLGLMFNETNFLFQLLPFFFFLVDNRYYSKFLVENNLSTLSKQIKAFLTQQSLNSYYYFNYSTNAR